MKREHVQALIAIACAGYLLAMASSFVPVAGPPPVGLISLMASCVAATGLLFLPGPKPRERMLGALFIATYLVLLTR